MLFSSCLSMALLHVRGGFSKSLVIASFLGCSPVLKLSHTLAGSTRSTACRDGGVPRARVAGMWSERHRPAVRGLFTGTTDHCPV